MFGLALLRDCCDPRSFHYLADEEVYRGAASGACTQSKREIRLAHRKTDACVFVKIHHANCWHKSSLLANHESQNFVLHLRWRRSFATPPNIPPPWPKSSPFLPQIFPYPFALTFPFFFSFISKTSFSKKSISSSFINNKLQ